MFIVITKSIYIYVFLRNILIERRFKKLKHKGQILQITGINKDMLVSYIFICVLCYKLKHIFWTFYFRIYTINLNYIDMFHNFIVLDILSYYSLYDISFQIKSVNVSNVYHVTTIDTSPSS